ncbi:MAG: hypothetical protein AAFY42_13255, partial [Pseudomonadota bacterium]
AERGKIDRCKSVTRSPASAIVDKKLMHNPIVVVESRFIPNKYTQEKSWRGDSLPLEGKCDMMPARTVPLGVSSLHPEAPGAARPAPRYGAEAMAFLNHLRFVAMACRTKPRTDLFRACAMLQVNATASQSAHAEALMRCLGEALGQAPRLHAPGSSELTFDERWLIVLAQASVRGDTDSLAFLLRSRIGREHRRLVGFLIANISECFPLF